MKPSKKATDVPAGSQTLAYLVAFVSGIVVMDLVVRRQVSSIVINQTFEEPNLAPNS